MEIKGKVFVVGPNGEEPDRMPIGMIIENPKANFWAPASWQGAQTSIVGKHVQWPETLPLATRLALDVLQGKTESAVILADALAEQHTGNVSELQVEIRRRIDLAVADGTHRTPRTKIWSPSGPPRAVARASSSANAEGTSVPAELESRSAPGARIARTTGRKTSTTGRTCHETLVVPGILVGGPQPGGASAPSPCLVGQRVRSDPAPVPTERLDARLDRAEGCKGRKVCLCRSPGKHRIRSCR